MIKNAGKSGRAAGVPYTMRLPDGRTVYLEIPGRWATADRDGKVALLPPAVRLLDRVRALAMRLDRPPTPGFILALRQALDLTQEQLAERIGVDKLTVSRWERGKVRPGKDSLAAIERLRRERVRKGVTVSV